MYVICLGTVEKFGVTASEVNKKGNIEKLIRNERT